MKTYERILVRRNGFDVSDEVCLKRFVGTIQPSVLTYLLKGDDTDSRLLLIFSVIVK